MVCLNDFYEETGFSRSLLGSVLKVSVDTLRKYEWSDTDRMRYSTLEKIEYGVRRLSEFGFNVCPLHFGRGFVVSWEKPEPNKIKVSGDQIAKLIQGLAGLH